MKPTFRDFEKMRTKELKVLEIPEMGLKFWERKNTSDIKSMLEVIINNDYQRRWFKILPGENWLDLGGYVGHFGVLAGYLGAKVRAFEPFPESYDLYSKNIKLNKLEKMVELHQAAVIGGSKHKTASLGINKNGNFWRNSIIKTPAKGQEVQVKCVPFREAIKGMDCLKMDIEGSEFDILKELSILSKLKKMVYEHSFDINPDLDLYRAVIKNLQKIFKFVSYKKVPDNHKYWLPQWFPACAKIFCSNEEPTQPVVSRVWRKS